MHLGRPRDSTPAERKVLFWLLLLVCWGFAAALLYLGWAAPSEKATEAATARAAGYGFFAVGVALWLIRCAVAWLADRV